MVLSRRSPEDRRLEPVRYASVWPNCSKGTTRHSSSNEATSARPLAIAAQAPARINRESPSEGRASEGTFIFCCCVVIILLLLAFSGRCVCVLAIASSAYLKTPLSRTFATSTQGLLLAGRIFRIYLWLTCYLALRLRAHPHLPPSSSSPAVSSSSSYFRSRGGGVGTLFASPVFLCDGTLRRRRRSSIGRTTHFGCPFSNPGEMGTFTYRKSARGVGRYEEEG